MSLGFCFDFFSTSHQQSLDVWVKVPWSFLQSIQYIQYIHAMVQSPVYSAYLESMLAVATDVKSGYILVTVVQTFRLAQAW